MPVKTKKDGRVVYLGNSYTKLRRQKYEEQDGQCIECQGEVEFEYFELHHTGRGRGLGGGLRDDRKTVGLCHFCHEKQDKKKLFFSGRNGG